MNLRLPIIFIIVIKAILILFLILTIFKTNIKNNGLTIKNEVIKTSKTIEGKIK
jgi:hypothetical protein